MPRRRRRHTRRAGPPMSHTDIARASRGNPSRDQALGTGSGVLSGPGTGGSGVAAELFTTSLSSLLGLKYGIFLAGTSTRAPVLGFRPMRGWRWRVRKLPKPRISILSPPRSDRTMLSKIASTMTSDSFRVISTTRETSSIRSAFVIALSYNGLETAVSREIKEFASLLEVAVLETHDLFDGGGGCCRLALVVFEAGFLLIIGHGAQAEADFLFRLTHFDNFEVEFFAHTDGRLFGAAPAGIARHLGEVAKAFDSLRQLDKCAEAGQAAHAAVHGIADLMVLEIRLPGIRLELFDAERKAVGGGIDVENHRLYDLSLLEDLRGVLHALGPGEIGNVHHTVDALLDFDERAEVRHVAHPALDDRADAIPAIDRGPRIGLELLRSEEHTS